MGSVIYFTHVFNNTPSSSKFRSVRVKSDVAIKWLAFGLRVVKIPASILGTETASFDLRIFMIFLIPGQIAGITGLSEPTSQTLRQTSFQISIYQLSRHSLLHSLTCRE